MSVPEKQRRKIMLRVPVDKLQAIDEAAKRLGLDRNTYAIGVLTDTLPAATMNDRRVLEDHETRLKRLEDLAY